MSAFGNFLLRQLEDRQRLHPELTAGQFAEDLGITPSMFSRFTTSDALSCNRATLARICERISDEPLIQAETQAAYLRDQRVEAGKALVHITVEEPGRLREKAPSEARLDAEADAAHLDRKTLLALRRVIAGCGKSRRLARMVHDWGDLAAHEL